MAGGVEMLAMAGRVEGSAVVAMAGGIEVLAMAGRVEGSAVVAMAGIGVSSVASWCTLENVVGMLFCV